MQSAVAFCLLIVIVFSWVGIYETKQCIGDPNSENAGEDCDETEDETLNSVPVEDITIDDASPVETVETEALEAPEDLEAPEGLEAPEPTGAPEANGAPEATEAIVKNKEQVASTTGRKKTFSEFLIPVDTNDDNEEVAKEEVVPERPVDPYLHIYEKKEQQPGKTLRLPEFGDYECFLEEPIDSVCNGKRLTRYLMDQCMDTYVTITKNIQKACDKRHEVQQETMEEEITIDKQKKNNVLEGYQTQRCEQANYASLVTASVMCLTENFVRQKFIEHYADAASDNPVEGPVLYLKKMHEAMTEMSFSSAIKPVEVFPNMWRTFETSSSVYNPNAPFFLDRTQNIRLDMLSSSNRNESTQEHFIESNTLKCTDTDLLDDDLVYTELPGEVEYIQTKEFKCSQSAAYGHIVQEKGKYPTIMDRQCRLLNNTTEDSPTNPGDYLTDKSLRSLYDSVHYSDGVSESNIRTSTEDFASTRRPFTIAEAFIKSKGPVLDGFGMMYYCGHHACQANHRNDSKNQCFPKFDWKKDWSLYSEENDNDSDQNDKDFFFSEAILKKCLNTGLLTPEMIINNAQVSFANETIHSRSNICITEREIVDFVTEMYPSWAKEQDAMMLIFGRHLAGSRCFQAENGSCSTTHDVYRSLKIAVKELIEQCRSNEQPNSDATTVFVE